MMRKMGLKRPSKLQLGPKKVSPPSVPGERRASAVYSEGGGSNPGQPGFNVSFDSCASEPVVQLQQLQLQEMERDDCSEASCGQGSGSSGYSSGQQRGGPGCHAPVVLRHTPASSVSSPVEAGPGYSRTSLSSLDSGWASAQQPVMMSSFSSLASSPPPPPPPALSTFSRRLSTLSSSSVASAHGPPAPVPQRTSSIRGPGCSAASLRGSQESVSSSVCRSSVSGSDLYHPHVSAASAASSGAGRRYSSSSSLSSSRAGEEAICSLDIRQLLAQGGWVMYHQTAFIWSA